MKLLAEEPTVGRNSPDGGGPQRCRMKIPQEKKKGQGRGESPSAQPNPCTYPLWIVQEGRRFRGRWLRLFARLSSLRLSCLYPHLSRIFLVLATSLLFVLYVRTNDRAPRPVSSFVGSCTPSAAKQRGLDSGHTHLPVLGAAWKAWTPPFSLLGDYRLLSSRLPSVYLAFFVPFLSLSVCRSSLGLILCVPECPAPGLGFRPAEPLRPSTGCLPHPDLVRVVTSGFVSTEAKNERGRERLVGPWPRPPNGEELNNTLI